MSLQPEITSRTWAEFLSLITPRDDYDHFFSWLTKRVQRLPQYKLHNIPEYNGYVSAEDIVSDSIIKILNAIGRGAEFDKEKFPSYAVTVAKNLLIDRVRRRTKEVATLNSTTFKPLSSRTEQNEFNFDSRAATSILIRAVSNLSMDDVRILDFVLDRGDFNCREIAVTLNISEASARQRLSRLRKRLKKVILEERSATLLTRPPRQLPFSGSEDNQKNVTDTRSSGANGFGGSAGLAKTVMLFSAGSTACKTCKADAPLRNFKVVSTNLSQTVKRVSQTKLAGQLLQTNNVNKYQNVSHDLKELSKPRGEILPFNRRLFGPDDIEKACEGERAVG